MARAPEHMGALRRWQPAPALWAPWEKQWAQALRGLEPAVGLHSCLLLCPQVVRATTTTAATTQGWGVATIRGWARAKPRSTRLSPQ